MQIRDRGYISEPITRVSVVNRHQKEKEEPTHPIYLAGRDSGLGLSSLSEEGVIGEKDGLSPV